MIELGLTLLSGAWSKLLSAFDWCVKNPLITICIALAAFGMREYRVANSWEAKDKADNQLFSQQKAEAEKVTKAKEQKYKDDANNGQVLYQKLLSDNGSLTRMLSARRVQPPAATLAAIPAQGGDPAIPAVAPSDAVVASEKDLKTCDTLYDYAFSAYKWASTLNKQD